MHAPDVIEQFETGFGNRLAGERRLRWAMTLIAMIIGIPLFFEVGVVLVMPAILLMTRRSGVSPCARERPVHERGLEQQSQESLCIGVETEGIAPVHVLRNVPREHRDEECGGDVAHHSLVRSIGEHEAGTEGDLRDSRVDNRTVLVQRNPIGHLCPECAASERQMADACKGQRASEQCAGNSRETHADAGSSLHAGSQSRGHNVALARLRRGHAAAPAMSYDTAMDAVPSFEWIGWSDAGAIERVGPEAIVTSFWCVVVPVWAGNSFYRFRTRDGIETRFEIARQRKSIVLGYARTPLWFSAIILAAPVIFAGRWWSLVPIVAALAGVAAVLTFVVGRLPPEERERRELLRRVAGVGAPPELMPAQILDEIREGLADAWYQAENRDWRDAIPAGMASEVLVALADYYQVPRLLARARANLISAEGN